MSNFFWVQFRVVSVSDDLRIRRTLFRYRFFTELFRIGECFPTGELYLLPGHQRARIVEYDFDCAVSFGNGTRTRLRGEGGSLHQR